MAFILPIYRTGCFIIKVIFNHVKEFLIMYYGTVLQDATCMYDFMCEFQSISDYVISRYEMEKNGYLFSTLLILEDMMLCVQSVLFLYLFLSLIMSNYC